jgi:hypothetical protein
MSGSKTIEERAQEFYDAVFDKELVHLMDVAEGVKKPNKHEREGGIADEDSARESLQYHAYGISKEIVYYIEIAGGGPAARIKVIADDRGEVESASLQFCDWFEYWTDAPQQDPELVERYARLIGYYGE